MIRKLLAWAQRNERHLGALVFFGGFVTDVITFVFLDISLVNLVFAAYLALAALCIFLGHALAGWHGANGVFKRSVLVILPLVAQYLIGNLLSGFLIFYTKSSVLGVSWPFLILLLLIFAGNEWFRKYKDRITFMAVLLFFTTYAYAIFALPLFARMLGAGVFVGSTLLAVGSFSVFLLFLYRAGKARLAQSLVPIIGSCLAIVIVMSVSYFSGLLPPIPLTLRDGGIYHGVTSANGTYTLLAEPSQDWYDLSPQRLHVSAGEPLYAFAAVFAPIRFGTVVVHRWQRHDADKGAWVTQSRIAFPIAGGRAEGYRGYSEVTSPLPGEWRVRVETEGGQVIGQIRFVVEHATVPPILHTETR
jgi:hypothetical protein